MEICKLLNKTSSQVNSKVTFLIKKGILTRTRVLKDQNIFLDQIAEDYKTGMSTESIAEKYGKKVNTIQNYLRILRKQGKVEYKTVRKPRAAKSIKESTVTKEIYKFAPSTLSEGETVKCKPSVSKHCVYGVNSNFYWGMCRFIGATGKMRGCPHGACTRFSKVSRENPRLKGIGDA